VTLNCVTYGVAKTFRIIPTALSCSLIDQRKLTSMCMHSQLSRIFPEPSGTPSADI